MSNQGIAAITSLAIAVLAAAYYFSANFIILLMLPTPILWVAGRLRPTYEWLTTSAISGLLTLAMIEFFLPYLMSHPEMTRLYSLGYDSATDIGRQGTPGIFPSKALGPNGEPIYDVKYSIGDDGFRITPGNRLQAKTRVNFLGCSFTFGEGLNDDETLPYFVLRKMPHVSVKNLAFHGYGTHHSLAILQSQRDTRGDINVLLTMPYHAGRNSCVHVWNEGSPRYLLENAKVVRAGKCERPKEVLPTSGTILSKSSIYQQFAALANKERALKREDIDLYIALIKEIAALSRERGQKLVIAYIRADDDYLSSTGYTSESIFDVLKGIGDKTIDVTLSGEKYILHPLDGHPNKLANQDRADMIVRALNELLNEGH